MGYRNSNSGGRGNSIGQNRTAAARKKKRRRRYSLKLYYFILMLFVVGTGIILSLTVFFRVEKIEVVGNNLYDIDTVIKTSGLSTGKNLFLSDTGKAQIQLETGLPYIETAKVSRHLPGTLVITLQETAAFAAIQLQSGHALISESCKVLELINEGNGQEQGNGEQGQGEEEQENLQQQRNEEQEQNKEERDNRQYGGAIMLIKGIKVSEATPGYPVVFENEGDKLSLIDLIEAIKSNEFDKIDWIEFVDSTEINMMYDNRIKIRVGTPTVLDYKLQFAKHILTNNIGPNEKGTINLTLLTGDSDKVFFIADNE